MLDGEVKQKVEELKKLRQEISLIKKELNKLNSQKESWYSKKAAFTKQITDMISSVLGAKSQRNEMTKEVKGLKKQRDDYNKKIIDLRNEITDLKKQYDAVCGERKIQKTPGQLKTEIESLEYKMETEAFGFEKEKKLMKELKVMKKQLHELEGVSDIWTKIKEKRTELSNLRKESNNVHKQVRVKAASSQEKHEHVLGHSEEIDKIKAQEGEAFEKFQEFKTKFTEENEILKQKLIQLDELKELLKEHNVEVEEEQKAFEEKSIKVKAKEVNEKIKTGKKLTTEDLLIFQRANDK